MNVYIEKVDHASTLTTWIYCGMWQLCACLGAGHAGFMHWPNTRFRHLKALHDPDKFREKPNMFDWYFKQKGVSGPIPPADEVWVWETADDKKPVLSLTDHNLMNAPFEEINRFYVDHLDFSDEVNERGKALVDRYGIDFDKSIGLTWRGTDNVTDGRPRLPIELYFPFLDELFEDDPSLRVLCTAEEEQILDPVLKRYNAVRIEEFFSSPLGHRHNPERFSPFSGFERGMQPALMVWLFSKCKHYIHNRASTAAVADWLSNRAGKTICLGCNPTLDYDKPPIIHPKTGEQLWP